MNEHADPAGSSLLASEQQHQKTYLWMYVPCKDSDQHEHQADNKDSDQTAHTSEHTVFFTLWLR